MDAKAYEITTSHFRYYVKDVQSGESIAVYRSLVDAVKAYPAAKVNVPDSVKKACGIA